MYIVREEQILENKLASMTQSRIVTRYRRRRLSADEGLAAQRERSDQRQLPQRRMQLLVQAAQLLAPPMLFNQFQWLQRPSTSWNSLQVMHWGWVKPLVHLQSYSCVSNLKKMAVEITTITKTKLLL